MMTNNLKVEFPDLRVMSSKQKDDELTALREFWSSKNTGGRSPRWVVSFWSLIDRLFRWRILMLRIQNPLLAGKTELTAAEEKDAYLYCQELTDRPYFTFEALLDHTIRRLNKHVLLKAGRQAEGYIFTTETGKYEITIKEFNERL